MRSTDSSSNAKTSEWRQIFMRKRVTPSDLPELVIRIREGGESIATLNGSFDLLHAGHLHILHEAAGQADVLIVALNTDASIRAYKSKHRPIINLDDRLQMVASIGCVDFVTWFDQTDPRQLLGTIEPDVHVNGADYKGEWVEASVIKRCGGRLHAVELIPGLSTSQLIQRIQTCA